MTATPHCSPACRRGDMRWLAVGRRVPLARLHVRRQPDAVDVHLGFQSHDHRLGVHHIVGVAPPAHAPTPRPGLVARFLAKVGSYSYSTLPLALPVRHDDRRAGRAALARGPAVHLPVMVAALVVGAVVMGIVIITSSRARPWRCASGLFPTTTTSARNRRVARDVRRSPRRPRWMTRTPSSAGNVLNRQGWLLVVATGETSTAKGAKAARRREGRQGEWAAVRGR